MNIIIQIIFTLIYMIGPVIVLSIIMNKLENMKKKHKMIINDRMNDKVYIEYI